MRTLLLVLLAAGLAWLLLRSVPSSETQAAGPESAGTMLSPESDPAGESKPTAPPEAPKTGAGAAPVREAVESPQVAANPSHPAQPSTEDGPPKIDRGISSPSRSADVLLGELLAHTPAHAESRLESIAGGYSTSRLAWARALCALAAGDAVRAGQLAQGLDADGDLSGVELEFVRRGNAQTGVVPSSTGSDGPALSGARIALLARSARLRAEEGHARLAVLQLTEAILMDLHAPWRSDPAVLAEWSDFLARMARETRWKRDGEWPSVDVTVQKGESLISIRKRVIGEHPGLVVSTGLIARSNQLRGDVLHPGEKLRIPTERVRMLVDLDAHWAFYLMGDEIVCAWPVGVGKLGSETRPGEYRVGDKRKDPMWFPPGQEPVPFGDPRNPLGTRWIELEQPDGTATHLGFHGTNEPDSVGKDASQGCLRMRQGDIEELFEILPAGAGVTIQS